MEEKIVCPICFEPPHDPVLLLCASHESGCRPYMCHLGATNCFDQFCHSSSDLGVIFCPLCRGLVEEAVVFDSEACRYFNSRPRSCSEENCNFVGTRDELTSHVGEDHKPVLRAKGSEVRVVRRRRRMTGTEYKRLWRNAVLGERDG